MKLTYNHFRSYSMKARINWTQKVLIKLGYTDCNNCKRDKQYIKALSKFQKDNGLGGNAEVCEKTFDLLYSKGGDSVNINDRGEILA